MADTYITCDIGRLSDYTAISVIQVKFYDSKLVVGGVPEVSFDPRDVIPVFEVSLLERFQAGYRATLQRLQQIHDIPALFICDREILIDATGVGDAVLEMSREMHMDVTPISITGGDNAHYGEDRFYVPRTDLIDALVVAIQSRRLRISPDLDSRLTEQLNIEMNNLQIKRNPTTAKESYDAMIDAKHDDMAMSLAMGIWKGMQDHQREITYQENTDQHFGAGKVETDWANWGLNG